MAFRPSNARGRGRTDSHAGRILIHVPRGRPKSHVPNALLATIRDVSLKYSLACWKQLGARIGFMGQCVASFGLEIPTLQLMISFRGSLQRIGTVDDW